MKLLNKKKKDSGAMIGHMLPIVLTAIAMAAIAVIFSSWMMNLDRKNNIDVIARKYMLKMETVGGLTPDDRDSLKQELIDAGMQTEGLTIEASDKTGSPATDPGYGAQITLKITGKLKIYDYEFINLFRTDLKSGTIPISVVKKSTAKH